jgi:NAD(P)-dependent dehydrogenase (short-subunit alcohol dehydrogenase family)
MQIMATPYSETPQGFEIQFGTNYIGHYLFTRLLLPTLLTTAATAPRGSVRIVNVSSNGHGYASKAGIEFTNTNLKDASTWTRYGQSKLANILHARALADKFGDKGLLTASVHPGAVHT